MADITTEDTTTPESKELARQEDKPNFANETLDLEHLTLNQLNFIGKTMAASKMFSDVSDASRALVKILAGQEIGVTPFQAMTNIHIIQGKATMAANLMAAKVKGHPKYDYRVVKQTPDECEIDFFEINAMGQKEKIGTSSFTLAEAKAAGTQNLDKFPRNMLFARAMSNGTKWYTPDVFNGTLVYTPEEMGAKVNIDGEIIEAEAIKPSKAAAKESPITEKEKADIITKDAETERQVQPKQLARIHAMLKEKGVKADDMGPAVYGMAGVKSRTELTEKQADNLIAELDKLDKEGIENYIDRGAE